MNRLMMIIILALSASAVIGQTTLLEVSWQKLEAGGKLQAGRVERGTDMLTVGNPTGKTQDITVLTLDRPRIPGKEYSLAGSVAYKEMRREGAIEMLSYFGSGKPFFSRRELNGSSPLRPFSLPFSIVEGSSKPSKIELTVTLPAHATVYLGPLKLLDRASTSGGRVVFGKWRSDRELGRIGGTFGGIVGGFGGLIGILGGIVGTLAAAGKARRVVMGIMWFEIGFAVLCIIVGLVLLAIGEWWVFYAPLFFLGALILMIVGPMIPMIRRRYDEMELRKMSARDA